MKANKMEGGRESQSQISVNVKTTKTSSGKVRKRRTTQTKRRKLRGTVVKMLAMMESKPEPKPELSDPVMEFLVTGRTGRRNALADILGPHAAITSGDLPEKLQCLSTSDSDAGPSSSGSVVNPEDKGTSMDCISASPSCIEEKSEEKDANADQVNQSKSRDHHSPAKNVKNDPSCENKN